MCHESHLWLSEQMGGFLPRWEACLSKRSRTHGDPHQTLCILGKRKPYSRSPEDAWEGPAQVWGADSSLPRAGAEAKLLL